jgi:anti-sigma B factor antagonist
LERRVRETPAADSEACTLRLAGEVDVATVEGVLGEADRCLESGLPVLEVDMAAVTFIDSSGLGALVSIRNKARDQGTEVVLRNVSSASRRLLELSGLDQVFDTGQPG